MPTPTAPDSRSTPPHAPLAESPDANTFADQAELLALACGVPAALIALVHDGRFEVVGQVGYTAEVATIEADDELVARLNHRVLAPAIGPTDSAFAESAARHGLLAHGGLSLQSEDGSPIGLIVVSSCRSRRFNHAQHRATELVAARVVSALALQHTVAAQAAQLDDLGQSNAELLGWSTRDPLTGLANRKELIDVLERATTAEPSPGDLGVLFLDIDHFKAVNDTFGHQFGDAVLIAVGQRVRSVVRGSDCVARLGGDEFVVACLDTDAERLRALTERIEHTLAGPVVHADHSVHVRLSIGMAMTNEATASADELLRCADADMYRVKHQRRSETNQQS